jgi:hypothetical protein
MELYLLPAEEILLRLLEICDLRLLKATIATDQLILLMTDHHHHVNRHLRESPFPPNPRRRISRVNLMASLQRILMPVVSASLKLGLFPGVHKTPRTPKILPQARTSHGLINQNSSTWVGAIPSRRPRQRRHHLRNQRSRWNWTRHQYQNPRLLLQLLQTVVPSRRYALPLPNPWNP